MNTITRISGGTLVAAALAVGASALIGATTASASEAPEGTRIWSVAGSAAASAVSPDNRELGVTAYIFI